MPFAIFDDVRHLLVSDENPAREEGDLDYKRCAALHNAIVKHGWTASGSLSRHPAYNHCMGEGSKWLGEGYRPSSSIDGRVSQKSIRH